MKRNLNNVVTVFGTYKWCRRNCPFSFLLFPAQERQKEKEVNCFGVCVCVFFLFWIIICWFFIFSKLMSKWRIIAKWYEPSPVLEILVCLVFLPSSKSKKVENKRSVNCFELGHTLVSVWNRQADINLQAPVFFLLKVSIQHFSSSSSSSVLYQELFTDGSDLHAIPCPVYFWIVETMFMSTKKKKEMPKSAEYFGCSISTNKNKKDRSKKEINKQIHRIVFDCFEFGKTSLVKWTAKFHN